MSKKLKETEFITVNWGKDKEADREMLIREIARFIKDEVVLLKKSNFEWAGRRIVDLLDAYLYYKEKHDTQKTNT